MTRKLQGKATKQEVYAWERVVSQFYDAAQAPEGLVRCGRLALKCLDTLPDDEAIQITSFKKAHKSTIGKAMVLVLRFQWEGVLADAYAQDLEDFSMSWEMRHAEIVHRTEANAMVGATLYEAVCTLVQLGRWEEALMYQDQLLELEEGEDPLDTAEEYRKRGDILHKLERPKEAHSWYLKAQALFERELDEEYMSDSSIEGEIKATKLYNHACTLALVGESEKGLDALIKASKYDKSIIEYAKTDPEIIDVCALPRFQSLQAKRGWGVVKETLGTTQHFKFLSRRKPKILEEDPEEVEPEHHMGQFMIGVVEGSDLKNQNHSDYIGHD